MGDDFLAQYTHAIPQLRVNENLITRVHIETPFLQVVEHANQTLNYSAQHAVEDFYGKPAVFRMNLEICYMLDAPPANSVRVTIIQNDKEVVPQSEDRCAFFPATDPYTPPVDVGEIVKLEFDPRTLDSSTLTIRIDTPDDQPRKQNSTFSRSAKVRGRGELSSPRARTFPQHHQCWKGNLP